MLYLDIYVWGLPFLFFYNVCTGIFSALGDSRTPFLFHRRLHLTEFLFTEQPGYDNRAPDITSKSKGNENQRDLTLRGVSLCAKRLIGSCMANALGV